MRYVHNPLHEYHYPTPLVFGGGGSYHSLVSVETPVPPYTLTDYNWGLHYFVDANVATPQAESSGAIADGTPDTEATVVECKSFTGSVAMLGGGAIEAICQRQHLKNPDSHIAEVTAGGTCLNLAYTHRGTLGELRLCRRWNRRRSTTTRAPPSSLLATLALLKSRCGRTVALRLCEKASIWARCASSRSPTLTTVRTCSLNRWIMPNIAICSRARIRLRHRLSGVSRWRWRGESSISSMPGFSEIEGGCSHPDPTCSDPLSSFWDISHSCASNAQLFI
jgi:hypothetical protein